MDNINPRKLHKELEDAGIIINGCNSDGLVWDKDNKEIQDRSDVQAVIKKHDPMPIPIETEEEKIKRIVKENFTVEEKIK